MRSRCVFALAAVPQITRTLVHSLTRIHTHHYPSSGKLEAHYRDMQDMEFTVENGELYILQTRTGKRTARAAVRIAAEMAQTGCITEREALLRIKPEQMDFFLHPMIDPQVGVVVR
jgi:pyruvate,orthophosphate dikinase